MIMKKIKLPQTIVSKYLDLDIYYVSKLKREDDCFYVGFFYNVNYSQTKKQINSLKILSYYDKKFLYKTYRLLNRDLQFYLLPKKSSRFINDDLIVNYPFLAFRSRFTWLLLVHPEVKEKVYINVDSDCLLGIITGGIDVECSYLKTGLSLLSNRSNSNYANQEPYSFIPTAELLENSKKFGLEYGSLLDNCKFSNLNRWKVGHAYLITSKNGYTGWYRICLVLGRKKKGEIIHYNNFSGTTRLTYKYVPTISSYLNWSNMFLEHKCKEDFLIIYSVYCSSDKDDLPDNFDELLPMMFKSGNLQYESTKRKIKGVDLGSFLSSNTKLENNEFNLKVIDFAIKRLKELNNGKYNNSNYYYYYSISASSLLIYYLPENEVKKNKLLIKFLKETISERVFRLFSYYMNKLDNKTNIDEIIKNNQELLSIQKIIEKYEIQPTDFLKSLVKKSIND